MDDVPEVEAAKLAMELAERNYQPVGEPLKHNAIALETHDQAATEYRSAVAALPPGPCCRRSSCIRATARP